MYLIQIQIQTMRIFTLKEKHELVLPHKSQPQPKQQTRFLDVAVATFRQT